MKYMHNKLKRNLIAEFKDIKVIFQMFFHVIQIIQMLGNPVVMKIEN